LRYVAAIEPPRLAVNLLLEGADPILEAAHGHHLAAAPAARRMAALERRFAELSAEVRAARPPAPLRALSAGYAHTYKLEDAYLRALVTGLARSEFSGLPHTAEAQRAAIVRWRVGLYALARRLKVSLPSDLQRAGRGEIAPSPDGS
jgi:hypothetical protein